MGIRGLGPVMNCRMLPAWNKLDQEPREEVGDDKGGATGVGDGDARLHIGDSETLRCSALRYSGVLVSGVLCALEVDKAVDCRRRADNMANI